MMHRYVLGLLGLLGCAPVSAQTIVQVDLQIASNPPGGRVWTASVPMKDVVCNQTPPVVTPSLVDATAKFIYGDAANPGRVCIGPIPSSLFTVLPVGAYLATLTATDDQGRTSEASDPPASFVRAIDVSSQVLPPRTPACPNGTLADAIQFRFDDDPVGASVGGTSATFVKTDASTSGSWRGTYGQQGYVLANYATSLPATVTAAASGHATWMWAGATSDPRALQAPTGTNRVAATYYAGSFIVDVNVMDGVTHQLAAYLLDWDRAGRVTKLELLNGTTVLDTQTVANFGTGVYVVWRVSGHLTLRVTQVAGPNAVLSGLFLDAVGVTTKPPGETAWRPAWVCR